MLRFFNEAILPLLIGFFVSLAICAAWRHAFYLSGVAAVIGCAFSAYGVYANTRPRPRKTKSVADYRRRLEGENQAEMQSRLRRHRLIHERNRID